MVFIVRFAGLFGSIVLARGVKPWTVPFQSLYSSVFYSCLSVCFSPWVSLSLLIPACVSVVSRQSVCFVCRDVVVQLLVVAVVIRCELRRSHAPMYHR